MQKIIKRLIASLRTAGVTPTIIKVCKYSINKINRKKYEEKIFSIPNIEDKFTEIYRTNYWENFESVSGKGSTLEWTENLRLQLPELFEKFKIKTVFDAPCGDFNWMRYVVENTTINYIGGDIVYPLIEAHNTKYQNARTKFMHMDLTKDKFPASDLMICRDCLFHLSYSDTKLVLKNFIDSNIPYLLTTTFVDIGNFINKDITTGDFHYIDLISAPYHFPKDVLYRINDSLPSHPPRDMCLWSREQIILAMSMFQ